MNAQTGPHSLAFALPHLKAGGIEVVVKTLLCGLDRNRWAPVLILNRREGELLAGLPADVRVLTCGGKGLGPRALALARLLRRERPGLVYSGTNAMNLSAVLAVALLPARLRPRLVISEHTTAAAYLSQARHPALRRALVRALYPRADRLAVPLQSIAEGWRTAVGLPGPPAACLPNPVLEEAALEQLAADPPQRVPGRIVAAGRLIRDKGHDVLIRAFAGAAEACPHSSLRIYGSGPEQAALEALAASLNVSDRVQLMGYSGNLLRDFATAELAVLPSRREGFGNVAVEAMAAGTPLIATRCLGPAALLQGGRLGRLVPPDDAGALALAITEALHHPQPPSRTEAARQAALPYRASAAVQAFDRFAAKLLAGEGGTDTATTAESAVPQEGRAAGPR